MAIEKHLRSYELYICALDLEYMDRKDCINSAEIRSKAEIVNAITAMDGRGIFLYGSEKVRVTGAEYREYNFKMTSYCPGKCEYIYLEEFNELDRPRKIRVINKRFIEKVEIKIRKRKKPKKGRPTIARLVSEE